MTATELEQSRKEMAQRGNEIYDRVIRPHVEPQKNGQIVSIDVTTEDWEVDTDGITGARCLEARNPDAQIWMMRVGSRYLAHFGGRPKSYQLSCSLEPSTPISKPLLH